MNALKRLFDYGLDQRSQVRPDFERKVKYDEKGDEVITFEEVDYKKVIDSNGKALNWSLNNLLSAGINPDFPIHTGYGTNLQALNSIADFESIADSIISDENKNE